MQHWSAQPLTETRARLGEGSLWDSQQQRLWWVDIEGQRLFSYDPPTKHEAAFELPEPVGTVVVGADGSLLLAQARGLARFVPATRRLTSVIAELEPDRGGNRLNDGKCDPLGRLWVGSMASEDAPGTASLYCVDVDYSVQLLLSDVTISNGLAWAADGKTFYYVDTPTHKLVAYDCQLDPIRLTGRRTVFEFSKDHGSPDGMTIDSEGQLWVAMFGGSRVMRIDPATASVTGQISVPAKNVTSCAFGGPDQSVLFITTARLGMDDAELQTLPHSGRLCCVQLPVQGTPFQRFGR